MANGIYPKLPLDKHNNLIRDANFLKPALARYYDANRSASSVISVTHDTTALEIAAEGTGGALMRWVATSDTQASVTGSNFDHVIPSGQMRRFAIPQESAGIAQSVVGVNREYGLYQRVAVKSIGVASVLTAEF